ncbi:MAG: hypothetical protein ACOC7T_00610 [Planctomycetota bacterium]
MRKKRKILFGQKTGPEKLRETGKRYMDAGRYYDALDFFERAEADDLARQVAETAAEAGDVPLYMRAKKVLGDEISEEQWLDLAQRAEQADMLSGAKVAYRKAGREQEVERLEELVPGAEREASETDPEESG